jgi:hypothetical protein
MTRGGFARIGAPALRVNGRPLAVEWIEVDCEPTRNGAGGSSRQAAANACYPSPAQSDEIGAAKSLGPKGTTDFSS